MRKFLTRYHPRYSRSLVYMLQATDYHLREYWPWLGRVKDFRRVEYRKQLVKTTKARLLLLIALVLNLMFLTAVAWLLVSALGVGAKALAVLVALGIWPVLLAYLLPLPLLLGDLLIKQPQTLRLGKRTSRQLSAQRAVRVAVAGSYGKTTMREILKTVLEGAKKVAAPPLSYNTPLGIAKFVGTLDGDEDVIIFEFGEYKPGDIKRFSKLTRPDVGVLTGINEAHLSQFKTLETTQRNFQHLVDYLGAKPLFVNAEDERAATLAGNHAIGYSRRGGDGWKVSQAQTSLDGTSFKASKQGQSIMVRSHLLGLHQIGPLVAAIAIAERLGLTPEQIGQGLNRTEPFEHRLQPKALADGVTLIDDTYNANPDGIKAGLNFLKDLKAKRKLYITPGLVETGSQHQSLHQAIGRAIAKVADVVILIRNSATPHIAKGLEAAKFSGQLVWFDDALDCADALPQLTKHGDVVLWQNDWPDNYA